MSSISSITLLRITAEHLLIVLREPLRAIRIAAAIMIVIGLTLIRLH